MVLDATTTLIVLAMVLIGVTIYLYRQGIAALVARIRDFGVALGRVQCRKWVFDRLGYVAIVVYGVLVAVAFAFIPHSASEVRFTAARYLDKNTRLDDRLLTPPPIRTLDERLRLARERDRLLGKYVKNPIPSGQPVKSEDMLAAPDLSTIDIVVVDLSGEPDLALLNQGARVEILKSDSSPAQHASVLAVVKSGSKWLAMLRKGDLAAGPLGAVKEVRLEALPAHSP
jgi:hypothetical protein